MFVNYSNAISSHAVWTPNRGMTVFYDVRAGGQ
jgi:hypothetical protein